MPVLFYVISYFQIKKRYILSPMADTAATSKVKTLQEIEYCNKMLKGLFYQGYQCVKCHKAMHKVTTETT